MLSVQLFIFTLADGAAHVTSRATGKAPGYASGIRGRCASKTSLGATTSEPALKDVDEPDGAPPVAGAGMDRRLTDLRVLLQGLGSLLPLQRAQLGLQPLQEHLQVAL